MTAEMEIAKDGEGNNLSIQDQNNPQETGPIEPDESWWSAVLADEPMTDEHVEPLNAVIAAKPDFHGPRPAISISDDETTASVPDPSDSSVNWEKIRKAFTKDKILVLNVVGYNRGGILVAGEDVHGFVPASHLIDLPANLSEEDREQYLTSYLDRKISLKVIECEPDKERIVFSERAALAKEGQRRHLLNNLCSGDTVNGVVTNVTSFGAFVDLGGLEGLIHVSELSWGRVEHPADVVKVNNEVETIVLQVSEEEGKIALSLKRLKENPWDILSDKYLPGDIVDAEISSIVKYGAFARLNEGVEGLIHISSMNFPKDCTHIDDFLYEGQKVKVSILNIDSRKRRLGLKLERYQTE